MSIPKVINFIWFGDKKPEKVERCINSWKENLLDWIIKEWNLDNVDLSDAPPLIKKYINKKWAYVADYYRIKILKENPGFYLDTDMYMVRPISEDFLSKSFVACIESDGLINTGVIGCDSTNDFVKSLLNRILRFYETSTSINMSPQVITPIIREYYNFMDCEFKRDTNYDLPKAEPVHS